MSEILYLSELPDTSSSQFGVQTVLLIVIILLILIIIIALVFFVSRTGRNLSTNVTKVINDSQNTLNLIDCLAQNVQRVITAGCQSGLIPLFLPEFCNNLPAPCTIP